MTPGERKETARDLASFAVDGGALLIGVEEDKANRTFSLVPQPLSGLIERVEDMAGAIIDPPLDLVPYEIESEQQESYGYLLVGGAAVGRRTAHGRRRLLRSRGEEAHPAD